MSLELFAAAGLGVIVLGALLYALAVGAWRMRQDGGRLRLGEMMLRRGAHIGPGELEPFQAALAARRCVLCREKAVCDAWLASGRQEGSERFCPNAGFIAGNLIRIKRGR